MRKREKEEKMQKDGGEKKLSIYIFKITFK